MIDIFAITTRGLESVSAAELAGVVGVEVREVAYRRVLARCSGSLAALLALRTVDDVFLLLDSWPGVTHHRSALESMRASVKWLPIERAAVQVQSLRPIAAKPYFSVTASFVGKRNYNSDEIKQAIASGVQAATGWTYTPNDAAADRNLRVFIEHDVALVGLRLGRSALHERPYKVAHRPGSLKPPTAAALLALSGLVPKVHVLDPCCGAGTIPIEARLQGAEVLAGDWDAAALDAAEANAAAAGVTLILRRWDVRQLPLDAGAVELVVTNLPWGRQIPVDADLASFYHRTSRELRRVLASGGHMVLLTGIPDLVQIPGLVLEQRFEISLFGQNPTILVLRRDA